MTDEIERLTAEIERLTAERDALRDRYEPLRSWADGAEIDIRDLADQRDDLRAQLAQRDEELTVLREKVRAVYELVTLFDYTAVYDLKCDLLAALSDDQEGRETEGRMCGYPMDHNDPLLLCQAPYGHPLPGHYAHGRTLPVDQEGQDE